MTDMKSAPLPSFHGNRLEGSGEWSLDPDKKHPWHVRVAQGFPNVYGDVATVHYRPDAVAIIGLPELHRAALEMVVLMQDSLTDHIYQDDDRIPANCKTLASIQRVRAALGLAPAVAETVAVWDYTASYCDAWGEPQTLELEVLADTIDQAMEIGRTSLALHDPDASKVDARVVQVSK